MTKFTIKGANNLAAVIKLTTLAEEKEQDIGTSLQRIVEIVYEKCHADTAIDLKTAIDNALVGIALPYVTLKQVSDVLSDTYEKNSGE